MTIAIFPQELSMLPQWGIDRQSIFLSDESNHGEKDAPVEPVGVAKAIATAKKVFKVAKSRYGWSDSQIQDLLSKSIKREDFYQLHNIAKALLLADASVNFARLAEKTADFSYWLDLNPKQREVLFSANSQFQDILNTASNINWLTRANIICRSISLSINFGKVFDESIDNQKILMSNISQMERIFEKKDGRNHRVLNYSNMTQEQRESAIESSKKRRQEFADSLTDEQLKESDEQFKRLFETLEEARK